MKNTIKKWIYAGAAMTTAMYSQTFAEISAGQDKINNGIVWNTNSAEVAIQNYIASALTFLYLAAVIYGLWGGFHILTAGWDDEKVGKGKKIIINALIGIVVIFLAGSIVQWLIGIVTWGASS